MTQVITAFRVAADYMNLRASAKQFWAVDENLNIGFSLGLPPVGQS